MLGMLHARLCHTFLVFLSYTMYIQYLVVTVLKFSSRVALVGFKGKRRQGGGN